MLTLITLGAGCFMAHSDKSEVQDLAAIPIIGSLFALLLDFITIMCFIDCITRK